MFGQNNELITVANGSNAVFVQLVEIFYELFIICLIFLLMARLWLLYYDYCFSLASVNKIWRNNINSNENNFWLSNKKTFGNLRYVLSMICLIDVLILLLYLLTTFVLFNGHTNESNVNSSLIVRIFTKIFITLLAVLSIFAIINKISKIFDTFQIKQEIKRLLICLIIFSILTVLDECLLNLFFTYDTNENNNSAAIALRQFDYILDMLCFALMTFLQVKHSYFRSFLFFLCFFPFYLQFGLLVLILFKFAFCFICLLSN